VPPLKPTTTMMAENNGPIGRSRRPPGASQGATQTARDGAVPGPLPAPSGAERAAPCAKRNLRRCFVQQTAINGRPGNGLKARAGAEAQAGRAGAGWSARAAAGCGEPGSGKTPGVFRSLSDRVRTLGAGQAKVRDFATKRIFCYLPVRCPVLDILRAGDRAGTAHPSSLLLSSTGPSTAFPPVPWRSSPASASLLMCPRTWPMPCGTMWTRSLFPLPAPAVARRGNRTDHRQPD
jgi:hypothetical protein